MPITRLAGTILIVAISRGLLAQNAIASLPKKLPKVLNKSVSGSGKYSVQFPAGRFVATGATPELLIELAYKVMGFQIDAAPAWISSERYDIDEKIEDLSDQTPISPEEREVKRRQVIQSLLEDRFKLKVSCKAKDLPFMHWLLRRTVQSSRQRRPPGGDL